MSLRFGTDGVRGVANTELTAQFALSLARAAARVLSPPLVVVGRDTRRSGPMLQAAVCAGFAAEGVDVQVLDVAPTPAVAHLADRLGAAGAMISASHNPFADNGIKLFAVGGRKLTDDQEQAIEAALGELDPPARSGAGVGVIGPIEGLGSYLEHLTRSVETRLDGLSLVLDVANGAAVHTAPEVFRALGAQITVINDRPDGCNINDHCGATHPAGLAAVVVAHGADLGLAFDGDADRCVAVDAAGTVIDGDQLIAALALDLDARGELRNRTVVVTVMTNLGFHRAMREHGITVVETPVGDRAVLDAIDGGGHVLGGEQSGHVIVRHLASTGDGTLTGAQFAAAMARSGRSAADLAGVMTRSPQRLVNVTVPRQDTRVMEALAPWVDEARDRLGERGRVLVRPSGTEPLLRIMVEAETDHEAVGEADALAERARTIAAELGTVP